MIKRFLFYVIYSTVIFLIGYIVSYPLKDNLPVEIINITFFMSSITVQYLFVSRFYEINKPSQIILTIAAWLISMAAGILTLVNYAFDKKKNPADLIGLITYLSLTYFIYEICYAVRTKKVT